MGPGIGETCDNDGRLVCRWTASSVIYPRFSTGGFSRANELK